MASLRMTNIVIVAVLGTAAAFAVCEPYEPLPVNLADIGGVSIGENVVTSLVGVATKADLEAVGLQASLGVAAAEAAIDAHADNKENPHGVTAAQVGAPTVAEYTGHKNSKANPHGVTAEQVGALPLAGGTLDYGASIKGGGLQGTFSLGDGHPNLLFRNSPTLYSTLDCSELIFNGGGGRNLRYTGDGIEFVAGGGSAIWSGFRAPGVYELASLSDVDTVGSRVSAVEGAVADLPDAAAVSNEAHNVATSLIGHPHVLQGSTVVPTTAYTTELGGGATRIGDVVHLVPYSATRPDEAGSTGTLYIATSPDSYIVDVSGDIRVSIPAGMLIPQTYYPVEWVSRRIDATNWIIQAWAPGSPRTYSAKDGYYATLSNLVVYTYNRPGYRPGALTNDTAAINMYADSIDVGKAASRRVATAGGVRDYVDGRKREIAASAWRITPAGRDAPSTQTVTLDLPLVQQGQIAYLQSGDYYVLSYEGGDWRSTSEGSRWQIGASGRADFSITSEGRMGHVRDFEVAGNVAHIYASTNWMHGAGSPYIEMTESLDDPQWLACQDCVANYHVDAANGDYWLFTAPATANQMFYRVVIPGGERRIISTPTHRFEGGVEFGGVIYNIITITNGTERFEVLGRRL